MKTIALLQWTCKSLLSFVGARFCSVSTEAPRTRLEVNCAHDLPPFISDSASKLRTTSGFTLTEVLIVTAIGTTMMGMTVLTSVGLYKDLTAANAYRDIHENARQAMARLGKDIRSAYAVGSNSSTNLQLSTINSSGGSNTVTYFLQDSASDPTIKNLIRAETSGSTSTTNALTDHATTVDFQYWSNPGTLASGPSDTFEVRAYLTITNTSAFRISSDLLQVRVLMRNKHY